MIRLHRTAPDVTTLGPGIRFCIWVQGCLRSCPGCMSPDTRPLDGGTWIEEETLADRMMPFSFEGITISGGEPMLQSAGLCKLIHLLREKRDIGVIVYTGFTLEELYELQNPDQLAFLNETDVLIDGPYMRELDDNASLRGSSNQRIHFLTERYKKDAVCFGVPDGRRQQLQIDDQGVWIIGLQNNHM